ncbi:hypothetical protein LMG29542_08194 [Paraburkholderia humisilvae]|uniref:3-oxoacyl-[acyl-carrier-protein] reductase n=1 Tax=Paraburkholderia humisilvae TaxID=627669 RepID=A0A6J5FAU7_9BURK|nr:hypothetical protein LMG29542_08194 [Paraburkholderia humisilvae]
MARPRKEIHYEGRVFNAIESSSWVPKGIRVNAVAPGFLDTSTLTTVPDEVLEDEKLGPLRRLGKPQEIVRIFAFLASEEASYINGAVIEASGDMTL